MNNSKTARFRWISCLILVAGVFLATSNAQADIVPFFNTGVDSSGNPLGGGSQDLHYTATYQVVGSPTNQAVVLSALWGSWPTPGDAKWIGWVDNAYPGSYGTYAFSTTFNLTGYDPSTAKLSGKWTPDNVGYIYLNGVYTGNSTSDFSNLSNFTLTTGFKSGVNTLTFQVDMPDGYDGLLVSGTQLTANSVPLPPTALLMGSGLLGLGLLRFRKRA